MIGTGRLRIEYLKQIMIDMEKDSYKELKGSSCKREARRSAENKSNDLRSTEDKCDIVMCRNGETVHTHTYVFGNHFRKKYFNTI